MKERAVIHSTKTFMHQDVVPEIGQGHMRTSF